MSDDRYARLATTLLGRQPRPAHSDSLGDRAAAVQALEQALRGRARRRVWRNAGIGAAAAAVLVVAWGWALQLSPEPLVEHVAPGLQVPPAPLAIGNAATREGATLVRGPSARALGEQVPLRTGDRLRARHAATLSVSLSTGTKLALAGTGELALLELGAVQRFDLPAGRLRADVAKLEDGQRFLISTDDSEIEVKGTSFEVTALDRPACSDGTRTRVKVFEGVVTVRRAGGDAVQVRAGASWPPDCRSPEPPPPPAPPRPTAARPPAAPPVEVPAPVEAPPPIEAPPPPPSSTLAAQNDLFSRALQARRDGDTGGALQHLDELLVRFPDGALAETAAAERRKLRAERRRTRR